MFFTEDWKQYRMQNQNIKSAYGQRGAVCGLYGYNNGAFGSKYGRYPNVGRYGAHGKNCSTAYLDGHVELADLHSELVSARAGARRKRTERLPQTAGFHHLHSES